MILKDLNFYYDRVRQVTVWLTASGPNTPAVGKKIFFDEDDDLDNNIVCGLNVQLSEDQASIYTNQSYDLFAEATGRNFLINIKRGQKDGFYLRDYPMVMFSNAVNDGIYKATRWRMKSADSYLEVKNMTGVVTNRPLIFNFYLLDPANEKEFYQDWFRIQKELKERPGARSSFCE